MCGIFGVINIKEKIDESRVLAARDVLAHRGPDDAGIYFSPDRHTEQLAPTYRGSRSVDANNPPYVALAHRRLSIIDLSPAAHQPMVLKSKGQSAESSPFDSPDGSGQAAQGDKSRTGFAQGDTRRKDSAEGDKNNAPRYAIVFNGEIYNYEEIKSQVGSRQSAVGNKFKSNSDTEILLNLYIEYGKDCLKMLRGMFAFAIWDVKEKTLFAARDRFGIKPFYYLINNDEFIFSSELKAIKHYKNNLTLSMDGIDAFLRTGSVPAPLTIYNEVSSLLPGNYLEIKFVETKHASSLPNECKIAPSPFESPDGSGQAAQGDIKLEIGKYWNFSDLFEKPSVFSSQSLKNKKEDSHTERSRSVIKPYDTDAKKKIRTALLDSVKAHLVADVEVGAFLSGGIDSTAIVSLMRQAGQEKIKTVSVVFPGNKLDESKYSRLAAKAYNTEHIEIPFYEKDLLADFDTIMTSMDQPTIDGINTYFVSKAAKQAGLKVVLSGLGGDELFGGYPTFNLIPKYQRIKNLPFAKIFMKAAAPLLKNKLPAKAIEYMKNPNVQNSEYKLIRGLFTDDELNSIGWKYKSPQSSVFSPQTVNDSMTTNGLSSTPNTMPYVGTKWKSRFIGALTPLQYVSMMETTQYMRNQLLRDSDVFSMAHSLELRVPFVDHLLYENVLPYIDDGFDKNFPKKMLVDAVGDIPLELINRPKMGFTFPFADWMSRGQLKDLMIKSINNLKNTSTINHIPSNINNLHWSRMWALFVLSKFIK